MKIEIRKAELKELDKAFRLLKGAAQWLNKKNIDYWQDWLNPPDNFKQWVKDGFFNNEFYYVYNNLDLIGMFRLQWSDELFWGKQQNDSGYIHSFTIDRDYYGTGLGVEVLKEIEKLCRENHKRFLRLDCGVDIKKLCEYYQNQGFVAKGEVIVLGERLSLYEKQL
jgi:GNAT superfamily N-acetyltransferase